MGIWAMALGVGLGVLAVAMQSLGVSGLVPALVGVVLVIFGIFAAF
ncbi:hypothetical protein Kisp01_06290 [Kineosporia sp. NBRC 101677]|nr:hypothetical protein Kisp01_06290 [Kineosporia sp. NBRC 101677]